VDENGARAHVDRSSVLEIECLCDRSMVLEDRTPMYKAHSLLYSTAYGLLNASSEIDL
jgi:hypothetical protein